MKKCSTFLEHLETTQGNSAETRNIRLAAIRSFFRCLQHREPATVEQVRRVLAIPFKKTDTRLVAYLFQCRPCLTLLIHLRGRGFEIEPCYILRRALGFEFPN